MTGVGTEKKKNLLDAALSKGLVLGVEKRILGAKGVNVELVAPADLRADAGAAVGVLEAGREPAAFLLADGCSDLGDALDGGLVDHADALVPLADLQAAAQAD